jgi:hypothetical protein
MAMPEPNPIKPQNVEDNRNAQESSGAAPGSTPDPERIGPQKVEADGHAQQSSGNAPESPSGRERISQRKLDANRRNALKSTGPLSEEGLKISSMNALRHGLLAREVVIKLGDYQEDQTEFLELLDSVWNRHQPVGAEEEFEVQTIAACYWWKARYARYLNAMTRKRTLGMRRREARRLDDRFEEVHRFTRSLLEQSARGLEHVIAVMEDVKEQLQDQEKILTGDVPAELQESLQWLLDRYPEDFVPADEVASKEVTMLTGKPAVLVDRAYLQQVTAAIDQHLSRLAMLRRDAAHFEELELLAKIEVAALPTKGLDHGARYAAAKDRELDGSQKRLDVLQQRRRASGRIGPANHS